MSNELAPPAPIFTLNIITIIALLVFLVNFIKVKEKNYGLYMILILTISDFAYPIVNCIIILLEGEVKKHAETRKLFGVIVIVIYIFNISWSAAFALYTYRTLHSIKSSKLFNFKQFLVRSLVFCVFLTSIFPLLVIFEIWGHDFEYKITGNYSVYFLPDDYEDQILAFLFVDIIGQCCPLLFISYCYDRASKLLESISPEIHKRSHSKLLFFSLIPIICFFPGVIMDVYFRLKHESHTLFATIFVNLSHRAWPFLNLYAFWDLIGNPKSSKDSIVLSHSTQLAALNA